MTRDCKHILIIASRNHNLLFLKDLMDEEEWQIDYTSNAEEGIRIIRDKSPLITLVDHSENPSMGFYILDSIYLDNLTTRVILLSKETWPTHIRKAFEKGAYDYVSYPFNINDLKNKLTTAAFSEPNKTRGYYAK